MGRPNSDDLTRDLVLELMTAARQTDIEMVWEIEMFLQCYNARAV